MSTTVVKHPTLSALNCQKYFQKLKNVRFNRAIIVNFAYWKWLFMSHAVKTKQTMSNEILYILLPDFASHEMVYQAVS